MVMAGVAEDAKATNVGSVTYVESRGGFLGGLRSLFNSSQAALYLRVLGDQRCPYVPATCKVAAGPEFLAVRHTRLWRLTLSQSTRVCGNRENACSARSHN